jgi:hypothetical protein
MKEVCQTPRWSGFTGRSRCCLMHYIIHRQHFCCRRPPPETFRLAVMFTTPHQSRLLSVKLSLCRVQPLPASAGTARKGLYPVA